MNLLFLGTGAADTDMNLFQPSINFRRNSSALINDDLLIDPGPHIFHYAECNGRNDLFDNVKNIIVTHSHKDHFNPENFRRIYEKTGCTLWSDKACIRRLTEAFGEEFANSINYVETSPLQTYDIGNYKVSSLYSNHATPDQDEITRIYYITDGERNLFYGCDSSWIPTRSWNFIKEKPINTLVLELTCGDLASDDWRLFEHNTIEMLELMLRMFRKFNRFAPDVKFYTSHMAVTLHKPHADIVERLVPMGVTPAYDGLEIEI